MILSKNFESLNSTIYELDGIDISKISHKDSINNQIEEIKKLNIYKAARRGDETYIPRSLDVTELELIKESIRRKVFSNEFIEMLKQEINQV